MKSIVLTGGGSSGHVTPNLALYERLASLGISANYIGSSEGIEAQLAKEAGITFHSIQSGKLRRYWSLQNFFDPFKILLGILQATWRLWRLKPDTVFSKGGFVAFPVVIGAYINRIPVIAHESDLTPGLANKLCYPFVKKITVSFQETTRYLKKDKVVVTGTPIRPSLLQGTSDKGRAICGFNNKQPILLVVGGSLGASAINQCIHRSLDTLLTQFQVVHLCGHGHLNTALENHQGYKQFEYLNEEYPHILAASDIVISRAGANALYELLTLGKPNLLIPLSKRVSRGDQIMNARYAEEHGYSIIIQEDDLSETSLLEHLTRLQQNLQHYKSQLALFPKTDCLSALLKIILDSA